MLALTLAVLLAAAAPGRVSDAQICQDEQEPIGSGLGVLSVKERAKDLNEVVSVAKVSYVPYGKLALATVGYVVRIANGNMYYESEPGPKLTLAQRNAEANVLLDLTRGHPETVREAVASPLPIYFAIHFEQRAFERNALRVEHCTPR